MSKFLDLTGKIYGKLTVIKPGQKKNGRIAFVCKCECGKETTITGNALNVGNTKSCGCLQKQDASRRLINPLIGQKFHKLLVLEDDGTRTDGRRVKWKCVCDCGNTVHAIGKHLKNGYIKSCGCLRIQNNINKSGENHPNWNFQKTTEERIIQRSYINYYEWRRLVYKRDNYSCQICSVIGGKLNAHHLYSFQNNINLRTDLDNGITLCYFCHTLFHKLYGKKNNTKEQYLEFVNVRNKFITSSEGFCGEPGIGMSFFGCIRFGKERKPMC